MENDKIHLHENCSFDLQSVCCPTCELRQEWNDKCRRCGSDLQLLMNTAVKWFILRKKAADAILSNNPELALKTLRKLISLYPTSSLVAFYEFYSKLPHSEQEGHGVNLSDLSITLANQCQPGEMEKEI